MNQPSNIQGFRLKDVSLVVRIAYISGLESLLKRLLKSRKTCFSRVFPAFICCFVAPLIIPNNLIRQLKNHTIANYREETASLDLRLLKIESRILGSDSRNRHFRTSECSDWTRSRQSETDFGAQSSRKEGQKQRPFLRSKLGLSIHLRSKCILDFVKLLQFMKLYLQLRCLVVWDSIHSTKLKRGRVCGRATGANL